jgi:hypothetical protein
MMKIEYIENKKITALTGVSGWDIRD